mgnify:CR=1 FL=1
MPKFTELDGGRSENESANANKRNISGKSRGHFVWSTKKASPEGALEITEAARNFKHA